jgi:DNA-binding MarR family transcriptional regulator
VLNDTWYSRDLPVLTAIAEKLERSSAPVDTEQLIEELGLTRQDLTAALRALDVEYLVVRLSWRGSLRALVRRLVCGRRLRPVRLRRSGRVMIKNEAPARFRAMPSVRESVPCITDDHCYRPGTSG